MFRPRLCLRLCACTINGPAVKSRSHNADSSSCLRPLVAIAKIRPGAALSRTINDTTEDRCNGRGCLLTRARDGSHRAKEGRRRENESYRSREGWVERKNREKRRMISLSTNLVSRFSISSTKSSILSSLLIIPDIWCIYRRLRCKFQKRRQAIAWILRLFRVTFCCCERNIFFVDDGEF